MKLSSYGNEAQVSGVEHTQAFQMQMNSKMFSILTDKLYQNKEGAVIRELSANARDAHVAAGKSDIPFELTLPTWLSTEFKIRDFGTGIDPEDFYDIYTNLGQSTKDHDNTAIGAYGLGSKTPFAITDSYTIRNYWNGTVYVYTAFKDTGMPTVSLIGSERTDECNGLEISVDVAGRRDVFVEECGKQLAYFEVKPTVVNVSDFSWDDAVDITDGYHLEYGFYHQNITVVMGGISYNADVDGLPRETRDALRRVKATLSAELGEVDIPPSRESLEYTDKTLNFINNKVKFIQQDYQRKLKERVSAATNKVQLHTALSTRVIDWLPSREFNLSTYTFKGKSFTGLELTNMCMDSIPDVVIKENYALNKTLRNAFNDLSLVLRMLKGREKSLHTYTVHLNDISPRSTKLINENKDSLSKVIVFPTEKKMVNFAAAADKAEATLKSLGLTVIRLSTVIVVPVVVKGAKPANYTKPNQVFKIRADGEVNKDKSLELPTEGYYVPMSNWTLNQSKQYLQFITRELGHAVYGLRSDAVKSVVKSGNMTDVSTLRGVVVKKLTAMCVKANQAEANLSEMQRILASGNSDLYSLSNIEKVAHLPKNNQVRLLVETCSKAREASFESSLLHNDTTLKGSLGITCKVPEPNLKASLVAIAEYAEANYVAVLSYTLDTYGSYRMHKLARTKLFNQALTLITGNIK